MEDIKLPASIQGDGRKFISILKQYLHAMGQENSDIDKKIEEYIRKNNVTDEQLKNLDKNLSSKLATLDEYTKEELKKYIEMLRSMGEDVSLLEEMLNGKDTGATIKEQVKNITIDEKRVGGFITLDIRWNHSDIPYYNGVVIDIKESDKFDVPSWDSIDFSRQYTTGKTNRFTLDNCIAGHSYYIRIRAFNVKGEKSVARKAPIAKHYISPKDTTPELPYDFTVVFDKRGAYWSWKQVEESGTVWTELRLDEYVGEEHNRLEVTTDLFSTKMPPVRTGTAYLFNKGIGNKYTYPVTLSFTKPVPHAPKHIKITPIFEGFIIDFEEIPEDCNGAVVYVNGEKNYTKTNSYRHICSTGDYFIRVAFTDPFGEGEFSKIEEVSTVEEIPPDAVHITNKTVFDDGVIVGKYIGDRQIIGTKIQEDTISTGHIKANSITSSKVATNSISSDKIKSGAITTDKIDANAITGDKIQANSISGDKLQANSITGDKIAANSISADKLEAGAITADKIGSGIIDLDGGDISITTKGVSIDGTGMKIYSPNGETRFEDGGIFWYDKYGARYGAVRKMFAGTCYHNDIIRYNFDNPPTVLLSPTSIKTINGIEENIVVQAIDVTNKSFRVFAGKELPTEAGKLKIERQEDYYKTDKLCHKAVFYLEGRLEIKFSYYGKFKSNTFHVLVNGAEVPEHKKFDYKWHSRNDAITYSGSFIVNGTGLTTVEFITGLGYEESHTRDDYTSYTYIKDEDVLRSASLTYECVYGEHLIKNFLPINTPIKFLALENQEGIYTISSGKVKATVFKGRGTYKFKPKGERAKVYVLGASVKPSHGKRPDSSESSFVGDGIEIKSKLWTQLDSYKQEVNASHDSSFYRSEHAELFGPFIMGASRPTTRDNANPIRIDGYNIESLARIKVPLTNPIDTPTDYVKYFNIEEIKSRVGSSGTESGLPLPMAGASMFEFNHNVYNASYCRSIARYYDGSVTHYGGLSIPVSQEVELKKDLEYTVTVGACPDIEPNGMIDTKAKERDKVYVADISLFDGCVVIYEEGS